MVDKLREHLNRHLPRIGKKKVDLLVVSYVAKLVGRLCDCFYVQKSSKPGLEMTYKARVYSGGFSFLFYLPFNLPIYP